MFWKGIVVKKQQSSVIVFPVIVFGCESWTKKKAE